jgi:uncharacterized surface protein with fasciclin (FAS1) repeats
MDRTWADSGQQLNHSPQTSHQEFAMKRYLAIAAVVPALALGAAACGGDDESTGAGATSQQEAPSTQQNAGNVVALAKTTPDLSTLVTAVSTADLVKTLQGKGPFTVFAPTNAAFEKLGDDQVQSLLEPESRDQLTKILTYHVVPGTLTAADLRDGQKLETVAGETLTVEVDGDKVMVGDATVVKPDVEASNGVVHVIDSVLTPAA